MEAQLLTLYLFMQVTAVNSFPLVYAKYIAAHTYYEHIIFQMEDGIKYRREKWKHVFQTVGLTFCSSWT